MKTIESDIVIIGNGLAGSTLANALVHHPSLSQKNDASIHIIDMGEPLNHFNKTPDEQAYDIRISSINRGSENIIREVGAWPYLNQERVFPYRYVEVSDSESSNKPALVFDAQENNLHHMGIMVENQHLVYALHQNLLVHSSTCEMHFDTKVASIHYDETNQKWHVKTNKVHFICTLLVGADGRNSKVRQAANIEVSKGFYQQKCIVGNIQVDGLLNDTAWQRFLDTGPIGVLPMSAEGESPARFSLAWSCDEPLIDDIMNEYQQNKSAFIDRLQPLLPDHFGNIIAADNIASYPLWHQKALHYHLPGLALIGDAAHSIHPLAGLGANLGIRDAASLAQQLFMIDQLDKADNINHAASQYQAKCQQYNALVLNTMSVFKSLFAKENSFIPAKWISNAITLGNNITFVKSKLLEAATGLDKNAPNLTPFLVKNGDVNNRQNENMTDENQQPI